MPDADPPSSSEPSAIRNLPALIPQARQGAPESTDNWFTRTLRTIFRWKSSTIRADLKDVLEGAGDTGFSPAERTMLKNILGLRERRVADVMVPRADIIGVQRDIALGELMKVFESAGHSRLVVYDETLDDATGMVHIRDLVAFMTVRATLSGTANRRRKKPLPAGLDLKAVDLSIPLSAAKIVREILYAPPSMPVLDLLAKMQTTRIHLALVVEQAVEQGAEAGVGHGQQQGLDHHATVDPPVGHGPRVEARPQARSPQACRDAAGCRTTPAGSGAAPESSP